MMNRPAYNRRPWPFALAITVLAAGAGLGGCSRMADGFASGAFVDPARYDLYDCKQLAAERKSYAGTIKEQERLMNKADTGVAGPVVAEIAYGNNLATARASAKLVDEVWQRNKCTDAAAASPSTPPPPTRPNISPGNARSPGRSGSAVR